MVSVLCTKGSWETVNGLIIFPSVFLAKKREKYSYQHGQFAKPFILTLSPTCYAKDQQQNLDSNKRAR